MFIKHLKKLRSSLKGIISGSFGIVLNSYNKVIIKSVPSPLFEELLLKLKQVSYKLPDFKNPIEKQYHGGEVIISNNRGVQRES